MKISKLSMGYIEKYYLGMESLSQGHKSWCYFYCHTGMNKRCTWWRFHLFMKTDDCEDSAASALSSPVAPTVVIMPSPMGWLVAGSASEWLKVWSVYITWLQNQHKMTFIYDMIWCIISYIDMKWYRIIWYRIISCHVTSFHIIPHRYELSWLRVVLRSSLLEYKLSWIRVVLDTSCIGYELSWVRVVQITFWITVPIVYSTVCSDAEQRKHQSSASWAFLKGIY